MSDIPEFPRPDTTLPTITPDASMGNFLDTIMGQQQVVIALIVIGVLIPFVWKFVLQSVNTNGIRTQIGNALMSIPRIPMMVLMAIPEQVVMAMFEPGLALWKRLSVSVAMYLAHFAYNGFVMKPEHSYNEVVWIMATALYARYGLNVRPSTFWALISSDSIMTLTLRGLA